MINDPETVARAERLRRMMNDYIRTMTPQERDRMMQVHLAQAQGPVANARLLRSMMNFWIRVKQSQKKKDGSDGV